MNYNFKIIILALSSPKIKGVGPSFIKNNVSKWTYHNETPVDALSELLGSNKKFTSLYDIHTAVEDAERILDKCKDENIKTFTLLDAEYPNQLKILKDPPPVLYAKGNTDVLSWHKICIIGTRKPDETGVRITKKVSEHYKKKEWTICNGLADGIDIAAIENLDDYYSRTIGVLAGGLNFKSQKTLSKKISINADRTLKAGGLLVSEQPPDKKEDTYSIVGSCRIQAGISNGMILVQSTLEGGSKFALKSFCELNRPLAVISPLPGDLSNPLYSGNTAIMQNAQEGIRRMTDLQSNKIATTRVQIIKSRDDYDMFDHMIESQDITDQKLPL